MRFLSDLIRPLIDRMHILMLSLLIVVGFVGSIGVSTSGSTPQAPVGDSRIAYQAPTSPVEPHPAENPVRCL